MADHPILYMMVFMILLNSCMSPRTPSQTAVRNIVSQQCVSNSELKRELRRHDANRDAGVREIQ